MTCTTCRRPYRARRPSEPRCWRCRTGWRPSWRTLGVDRHAAPDVVRERAAALARSAATHAERARIERAQRAMLRRRRAEASS
ncbi:MAG: hypothetical protein AB1689_10615 [Thermodesulfobacteriota bacterium]